MSIDGNKSFKYNVRTSSKASYSIGSAENYTFLEDTLRDRIELFANRYPNHVAYIFAQNGGVQMTYTDLKRRVESVARNLISLGFRKGDRLAIQLPDTLELMLLIFACAYIGLIAVPIDSTRFSHELELILEKVSPSGLVLMAAFDGVDYVKHLTDILPEVSSCQIKGHLISRRFPQLKNVIVLKKLTGYSAKSAGSYNLTDITWSYDEIFNNNPNLDYISLPETNPHDIFIILFTSGTTGPKKGAASTFFKFLNSSNLYIQSLREKSPDLFNGFCNCLSFSFSAMLTTGFLPPLLHYPSRIVFPSFRRNILNTLRTIDTYKCKSLFAPPKFVLDMMSHEQFERFNTNPIRYVHTVGQILTHGVVKSAYKRFPNLKLFVNNYGMTEILRASFNPIKKFHSDDDDKENNDGEVYGDYSLGRALPFIEMKVIDVKSGALVPFGKTGELCVRGFSTLNFYWNEDDTNQGIDCNGWFRTGDIVHMDKNGFVFYKSRFREVIRFQDADVFPSDLECFLRTSHEAILDANVFSIAKNGYDEYLCAWIILNTNPTSDNKEVMLTIGEINQMLRGRIHSNRKLFIKIVNDFPTSSNGKVMKRELARIFKQELNL